MKKYYAAPMEGVTGFAWRKAHDQVFGGVDRYFTPFISPNQNLEFQTKELRDISQGEDKLVPQILTGKAEHFIWAAGELKARGFEEVNLNLGCPSRTVITKNKGSGLLRDINYLDHFLYDILDALPDMKISLKTRVGLHDTESWPALLEVFEKYPIYELIVHPRVSDLQYNGTADRKLFCSTLERESKRQVLSDAALTLVYNGDVRTPDDEAFSYGCSIMAGRGLVGDPALFRKARALESGGQEAAAKAAATSAELKEFHGILLETYRTYMPGDVPIIHRMKEFWFYYINLFRVPADAEKVLLKAKNMSDFINASNRVLSCPLRS